MRILIHFPGAFKKGLGIESPGRGETRWAGEYARMLSMAGHEVWCESNGYPDDSSLPIKLISERDAHKYGEFDLYIHTCWWDGRPINVKAKHYVHVHWCLEKYVRKKMPDNHWVAYVYATQKEKFMVPENENFDQTIFLPTMFHLDYFEKSQWDQPNLFLCSRFWQKSKDIDPKVRQIADTVLDVIKDYPIISVTSDQGLIKNWPDYVNNKTDSQWLGTIPYQDLRKHMKTCKLNIPILSPSNSLDAAAEGMPSVMWEHGSFFRDTARKHNLIIEHPAQPERIREVMTTLLTDKNTYESYLATIQSSLSAHQYPEAIKYFNSFISKL